MKRNFKKIAISTACVVTMLIPATGVYANNLTPNEIIANGNEIKATKSDSNETKNIIGYNTEFNANSHEEIDNNNKNIRLEFSEDTFDYLTYSDLETIESLLIDFRNDNPDASNDDLDDYAKELLIQASNNNINISNLANAYDWLTPSPEESAYMKSHPREVATYTYCSKLANNESEKRYTDDSRWYNGNGDAFRHVYWSASLVKRYYDVLGYDLTDAMDASERWTDIHEPVSDLDTLESEMDVQNNTTGRGIGSLLYKDNDYVGIINKVQYYIDNGLADRIERINGKDKIVGTSDTERK